MSLTVMCGQFEVAEHFTPKVCLISAQGWSWRQPWDKNTTRRFDCVDPTLSGFYFEIPGVNPRLSLCSNAGLKLANAFGVKTA